MAVFLPPVLLRPLPELGGGGGTEAANLFFVADEVSSSESSSSSSSYDARLDRESDRSASPLVT